MILEGRPLPIDLGHRLATECDWCGAPATSSIKDERRTVMSRKKGGSGSVFTGGPGKRYPACNPCAERLTERYLKAQVK